MSALIKSRTQTVQMDMLQKGYAQLPHVMNIMGYQSLRPGQEPVIVNILAQRDTLCILPTSTGKTACFVIPTLCLNWRTVVFSPLVALMRDQVMGLNAKGIKAQDVSSMRSEAENNAAIKRWAEGDLQFIYVAPERLHSEAFQEAMNRTPPDMVVMDEAHCFPGNYVVPTEFGPRTLKDLYMSFVAGHTLPRVYGRDKMGVIGLHSVTNAWRFNSAGKNMLRVILQDKGAVECTDDHVWFSGYTELAAKELKPGTLVSTASFDGDRSCRGLNTDQLQLVIGSYLGDGGLSSTNKACNSFRLAWTHGAAQRDYCAWKANILGGTLEDIDNNGYSGKSAVLGRSLVFQLLDTKLDKGGRWIKKSGIPKFMLDSMDARALAIWAMDDGSGHFGSTGLNGFTFSTNSFTENAVEALIELLLIKFDIVSNKFFHKGWSIRLNKDNAVKLRNIVAQHIHPDLCYKFGLVVTTPPVWDTTFTTTKTKVLRVEQIKNEEAFLYDLEIDNVHNFFVHTKTTTPSKRQLGYNTDNAVLVHNCLSQWSDNFRSSYHLVGDLIAKLNPKVVAAFSATCPDEAEADVRRVLHMQNAHRLLFYPRRSNLILKSGNMLSETQLADFVYDVKGPVIVYCSTINKVEQTAKQLSDWVKEGVMVFHGELSPTDKRVNQDLFMSDKVRVMVATNAFGMGIDKGNIRGVVHRDIPGSIEALAQEIGRAGRDGNDSTCMTFFSPDSYNTQKFFIESGHPSRAEISSVVRVLQLAADSDGVSQMTIADISKRTNLFSRKVPSILEILKSNKVIEREKNGDKIAKVRLDENTPEDDTRFDSWWQTIQDYGMEEDGFFHIDLNWLADHLGLGYQTITNHLKRWDNESVIRYVPPFRGSATKITGAVDQIDFDRLSLRAAQAHTKLEQVMKYVNTPDGDKHDFLESYFQIFK